MLAARLQLLRLNAEIAAHAGRDPLQRRARRIHLVAKMSDHAFDVERAATDFVEGRQLRQCSFELAAASCQMPHSQWSMSRGTAI